MEDEIKVFVSSLFLIVWGAYMLIAGVTPGLTFLTFVKALFTGEDFSKPQDTKVKKVKTQFLNCL